MIKVIFVYLNGKIQVCNANVGETVLQVAHKNEIPLLGTCEGSLSCSTCHVVVDKEWFHGKIAQRSESEEDILDFANGVKETSRLGCQIILDESMDGIILHLVSGKCCDGCCCS